MLGKFRTYPRKKLKELVWADGEVEIGNLKKLSGKELVVLS